MPTTRPVRTSAVTWTVVPLVCICLAACRGGGESSVTGSVAPKPVATLIADYPSYSSLTAMTIAAQAVLEVRTTAESESRMRNGVGPDGSASGSGVPITMWRARVTTVLAGTTRSGQNIVLSEPGGLGDDGSYVVSGSKKLTANTTYLVYVEFVEPGRAEVLGGDDGQFEKIGRSFVSPRFGAITLADAWAGVIAAEKAGRAPSRLVPPQRCRSDAAACEVM